MVKMAGLKRRQGRSDQNSMTWQRRPDVSNVSDPAIKIGLYAFCYSDYMVNRITINVFRRLAGELPVDVPSCGIDAPAGIMIKSGEVYRDEPRRVKEVLPWCGL